MTFVQGDLSETGPQRHVLPSLLLGGRVPDISTLVVLNILVSTICGINLELVMPVGGGVMFEEEIQETLRNLVSSAQLMRL